MVVVDGDSIGQWLLERLYRHQRLAHVLTGYRQLLVQHPFVERRHDVGRIVEILRIGQPDGHALVRLFPALDIGGQVLVVFHAGGQRGHDDALRALTQLLDHLRVESRLVAGDLGLHAELAHLRDDSREIADHAVDVDDVGIRRFHLEHQAGEIRTLLLVGLIHDDFAAGLLEAVAEDLGAVAARLVVHVQDGGAAFAHLLIGVFAERVHIHVRQREGRIDVIAQPRDGRRVRSHAEHQHLLAVGDGRNRLDHVAERGDVYRHFLHVDETVDHCDADLGFAW